MSPAEPFQRLASEVARDVPSDPMERWRAGVAMLMVFLQRTRSCMFRSLRAAPMRAPSGRVTLWRAGHMPKGAAAFRRQPAPKGTFTDISAGEEEACAIRVTGHCMLGRRLWRQAAQGPVQAG